MSPLFREFLSHTAAPTLAGAATLLFLGTYLLVVLKTRGTRMTGRYPDCSRLPFQEPDRVTPSHPTLDAAIERTAGKADHP